ncbi:MAG: hypothetical protein ABIR46_02980 [Candidatus Saccharimonadales bacterium]
MSPEAPKPDTTSVQTGSDKFGDIGHPTDRVREFKQGDLQDPEIHEALLREGVPDTIPIHPDTLETPVNKIPLETKEKTSSWKKWVAGLVGGAVLAGGGASVGNAMSGDSSADEPRVEPSASATSNPGEKTPVTSVEKSDEVVNIIGVETIPTPEQIAFAAENPILVEGGVPTAEGARAAYKLMGEYENIYTHSGTFEGNSLSGASVAAGEAIKNNLYGPEGVRNLNNSVDFENLARERELIGASLASYPGRLQSYGHWEAGSLDQVEEQTIGAQTIWKLPYTEYNEGNWDIVGETPERKNTMTGTVTISTYETSDGKLAWYHYDGTMDSMTVVSDTEVAGN